MSAESIKVCTRFRKELGIPDSEFAKWVFLKEEQKIKYEEKDWTYDFILTPDCEQDEMYEKVGKQTVEDFTEGYNGTIFAYGQSGSGKTFSMLGPEDVTDALAKDFNSVPEEVQKLYGIIPRAVMDIFKKINFFLSKGSECLLTCSYIEIYNEQINCLLSMKENLKIREHPSLGIYVADKEARPCRSPEEIFEVISIGTKNRAVGGTNQNARSSRSHTILLIEMVYNGFDGIKRVSKLNLVDLAGSERIAKTGAEGTRLKEAQKINQSLTTLGMCIMALTSSKSHHVPYRNSKLTLILRESLGGSAKTTLLCTASRLLKHEEESIQTLYFASRAKAIKNVCKMNVTMSAKELQYLADQLKSEVMILRGQIKKRKFAWHKVTDNKVLNFISNEMYTPEGEEKEEDKKIKNEKTRMSIMNLNQGELISKYVELHEKYDSLVEKTNAEPSVPQLNQEQIDKIKEEVNEALQEKEKEIVTLKKEWENKVKILKADLEEANENMEKMQTEKLQADIDKATIQSDLEECKQKLEEKEQDEKEKNNKIKDLENKNKELEAKIEKLMTEKEAAEKEKNNFKSELAKAEGAKNQVKSEADKVKNELNLNKVESENLKKNLEAKTKEEERLNSQVKELLSKIEALNKDLKTKDDALVEEIKKNNERSNALKKEIDGLKTQSQVDRTKIESLTEENKKIQGILNEKISADDALAQKQKIENDAKLKLEEKIKEISEENIRLKAEINEVKAASESKNKELHVRIEDLKREKENLETNYKQKHQELEKKVAESQEKLGSSTQKDEIYNKRISELEDKIRGLEEVISSMKANEDKLISERDNALKLSSEKSLTIEAQNKTIEDLRKQLAALKEEICKNKQSNEEERKQLKAELAVMTAKFETKEKEVHGAEQRQNELKAQISTLQNTTANLQNEVNRLSEENVINKQKLASSTYASTISSGSIKPAGAPGKTNIFGISLRKAGGERDLLSEVRKETKEMHKKAREIFKDNPLFFELGKNIEAASPETISSRDDMADLPELDFTNEETFEKAEKEMLEKEKIHREKKEKEKLEKEEKKKEMEKQMQLGH